MKIPRRLGQKERTSVFVSESDWASQKRKNQLVTLMIFLECSHPGVRAHVVCGSPMLKWKLYFLTHQPIFGNGSKQTMNMSGSFYLDFTKRILGRRESAMPKHWMKLFALAGLMGCEKAWMPSATRFDSRPERVRSCENIDQDMEISKIKHHPSAREQT